MNKNLQEYIMKKIYAVLAAALVTGFSAAPASAASYYISGNGGMSWFNNVKDGRDKYGLDDGFNAAGAFGMKSNCYRLEAELGYQTNNVDKIHTPSGTFSQHGDVEVWSVLANGYYDIYTGMGVKPYLTAGVGAARVQFEDVRDPGYNGWSEHDSVFAYQVGAGVSVPLGNHVALDARYRYFSTAEFTLNDGNQSRLSSNSVSLGLRVGL
jgi:opacity protein-like surface antigen